VTVGFSRMFEILTAVKIPVLVFLVVTLCGLVGNLTTVSEEYIPCIFRMNLSVEAMHYCEMLESSYKIT
jgi:hypothetical protein